MTRQILIIVIASFVLAQICTFATSIYLHRALAHRSLTLQPVTALLFRAVLWLLTGQSQQQWVSVHRKHHTFVDRDGDPHSPLLLGFWKVQLWNVYYYVREARQPKTIETFAPDLAPDGWERRVFSRGWTGIVLGTALVMLGIGWWQGSSICTGMDMDLCDRMEARIARTICLFRPMNWVERCRGMRSW